MLYLGILVHYVVSCGMIVPSILYVFHQSPRYHTDSQDGWCSTSALHSRTKGKALFSTNLQDSIYILLLETPFPSVDLWRFLPHLTTLSNDRIVTCVTWPEGRSQGGSKGRKVEVGARRAPKLLVYIYYSENNAWISQFLRCFCCILYLYCHRHHRLILYRLFMYAGLSMSPPPTYSAHTMYSPTCLFHVGLINED